MPNDPAPPQPSKLPLTAEPPEPPQDSAAPDPLIGQQIDRYKLLALIGEGGFGAVYLAEQREPVRRKVALKLIRLGMDTRQVVARFEAERQALAVMDHPNIARVFDAGATPTGRPYFVMELVRGVPITRYCDDQRLTTRQRLELFISVCRAVQHAHQKGIIHRDLKPTNVLVAIHDGKPVPKVIDFGIAKATTAELTQRTLFTEARQLIGTPEYMSPEQAEMTGLDIDTRSDVYSLGVLLYELLTGLPPFDARRLRSAALGEIQRIIRDEDPPRPSTRLNELIDAAPESDPPPAADPPPGDSRGSSTIHGAWIEHIARDRRTDPRHLTRQLRGDLDWIVMRAMEKDRTRRYETASAFAADLERFLSDQPVEAGPPGALYRMRKLYRRHRGRVTAAALLAAAVLLGLAGTSIGLRQALVAKGEVEESKRLLEAALERSESDRLDAEAARMRADDATAEALRQAELAREQAEIAAAINDLLNRDLLAMVAPEALGRDVTVRQVLDRAALQLDEQQFSTRPAVRATLEHTIGQAYLALGELDAAERHLERAAELRRPELGPDHPDTVRTDANLAAVFLHRGNYPEAFRRLLEVRQRATAALGESHPLTLGASVNLGLLLANVGEYEQSQRVLEAARRAAEEAHGPDHESAIAALGNLGNLAVSRGMIQQALELFVETLLRQNRSLGENHVDTLLTWSNIAHCHLQLGEPAQAETIYRRVLENRLRLLGEDHPETLGTKTNLGVVQQDQDRHEEAEPMLRDAVEGCTRVLGPDHPTTLFTMRAQARSLRVLLRHDEAIALQRATLEGWDRRSGQLRVEALTVRSELAETLEEAGHSEEARRLREEHVEILRNAAESPDADAETLNLAAWELLRLPEPVRDAELAVRYATRACEMTEHGNYYLLDTLALAVAAAGDPRRAIEIQHRAIELAGEGSHNMPALQRHLQSFMEQLGDAQPQP